MMTPEEAVAYYLSEAFKELQHCKGQDVVVITVTYTNLSNHIFSVPYALYNWHVILDHVGGEGFITFRARRGVTEGGAFRIAFSTPLRPPRPPRPPRQRHPPSLLLPAGAPKPPRCLMPHGCDKGDGVRLIRGYCASHYAKIRLQEARARYERRRSKIQKEGNFEP